MRFHKVYLLIALIGISLPICGCGNTEKTNPPHEPTVQTTACDTEPILFETENVVENTPPETQALITSTTIPNLPENFLDFQQYIGEDISVFGVDTSNWDFQGIAFRIGTASLFGNYGDVSFYYGWDNRTITGFSLQLDLATHQYIQGEEYNEVSRELEKIYGDGKRVYDGITDFSGKTDCRFRLMRNGAGMLWDSERSEEFERQNPDYNKPAETQPTVQPAPKEEPYIGMTAEQVLKSTWGKPSEINKTTTQYCVYEQWVYHGYRKNQYIYLEDGIVTAIQE